MAIIMRSDVPSKYTAQDAAADRAAKSLADYDAEVAEWLHNNPSVGSLNSGKFYVYPVGGVYREIEAFEEI